MSQLPDIEETQGDTKRKVLVVDDEPTLRLGFAYALSNRTTTVETAGTGRIALDRIAEVGFDIVILDLRMPELDGLGVIDALHSRAPLRICAMWMNLIGRPRRSAQPFWCMMQDMSPDTMYSAPACWWSVTLS